MFFYPIRQTIFDLIESSNELKILAPKKLNFFYQIGKLEESATEKLFGQRKRKEHSSLPFVCPSRQWDPKSIQIQQELTIAAINSWNSECAWPREKGNPDQGGL